MKKMNKMVALSVVPVTALSMIAAPAYAADEKDKVVDEGANIINVKVSGVERDKEAKVQLLDAKGKVLKEESATRNGARVSFKYDKEAVADGVLTVAVDGKTYSTVGAKCTAEKTNETPRADKGTKTNDQKSEKGTTVQSPSPSTSQSPTDNAPGTDGSTSTSGSATPPPGSDSASGTSDVLSGLFGGGVGDLIGKLAGSGDINGVINMLNGLLSGVGGKTFDLGNLGNIDVSQILKMLPFDGGEWDENYLAALEAAGQSGDFSVGDDKAKELNLTGAQRESAEALAEIVDVYTNGLQEVAGDNPTEDEVAVYTEEFADYVVDNISSEQYGALSDLLGNFSGQIKEMLNGPLGSMATAAIVDQLALMADAAMPGAGMAVRAMGPGVVNALKNMIGNELGDGNGTSGNNATGGGLSGLLGGALGGNTEGTTPTSGASTPSASVGSSVNAGSSVNVGAKLGSQAGSSRGTTATETAKPSEQSKAIDLEVKVDKHAVDITNVDEANLVNCSIDLLAGEFDADDVFKNIPTTSNATPSDKKASTPNANQAANTAGSASGPKVETGGSIQTGFVTKLVSLFK